MRKRKRRRRGRWRSWAAAFTLPHTSGPSLGGFRASWIIHAPDVLLIKFMVMIPYIPAIHMQTWSSVCWEEMIFLPFFCSLCSFNPDTSLSPVVPLSYLPVYFLPPPPPPRAHSNRLQTLHTFFTAAGSYTLHLKGAICKILLVGLQEWTKCLNPQ